MKDMLGRDEVVSAASAREKLLSHLTLKPQNDVRVPIEEALGRVSAVDVFSPEDLPHFSRSTVDGYAVQSSDTFGATETMPAYLTLSHEIFMGKRSDFTLGKTAAARIPTGGMLPEGADAVVMFEHAQAVDETMVEILRPVTPWENVIRAGDDVRKGDLMISSGSVLRPQHLGACAGVGVTELSVYERPRVAILSTGDEVVPASEPPEGAQVRDINSYVLAGMIAEAGGLPVKKGIFRDEYALIRSALEESLQDSDAVVLSGGTSVGIRDVIARIIDDIGEPGVVFHGVSLKPGKPMIGGVNRGIPVFGLPGHPAAVSICFEIFILPVLALLSGRKERFPGGRTVAAKLARNVASPIGREDHIRVVVERREDGYWAEPLLRKSGLITTLVKADGTFVVPVGKNGIEQGETVEVRLL